MNGTMIIKAEETSEGVRVEAETHLNHVNFEDKCQLVHCLCKVVEMTPRDLVFCAAMMGIGALNGDEETMIDLEKIQRAKENMDNES